MVREVAGSYSPTGLELSEVYAKGGEEMTITPWQMYWLARLDDVQGFFICVSLFSTFVGLVWLMFVAMERERVDKRAVGLLIAALVSGGISVFIPTNKQIVAIIVVPKIVNNAKVQEVPDKLLTLFTEWAEELRPGKDSK
jgi:hypothetical protein